MNHEVCEMWCGCGAIERALLRQQVPEAGAERERVREAPGSATGEAEAGDAAMRGMW